MDQFMHPEQAAHQDGEIIFRSTVLRLRTLVPRQREVLESGEYLAVYRHTHHDTSDHRNMLNGMRGVHAK